MDAGQGGIPGLKGKRQVLGHIGNEQDPQGAIKDDRLAGISREQPDRQNDPWNGDRHGRQESEKLVTAHEPALRDIGNEPRECCPRGGRHEGQKPARFCRFGRTSA